MGDQRVALIEKRKAPAGNRRGFFRPPHWQPERTGAWRSTWPQPPRAQPCTSIAAFIAPALAPLTPFWDDLPPEELKGIPTVCGSLRGALEELEKDMDFLLAGDVFTKDQIEGYVALKWEEVYAYEHTPHPIEYAMYYSC